MGGALLAAIICSAGGFETAVELMASLQKGVRVALAVAALSIESVGGVGCRVVWGFKVSLWGNGVDGGSSSSSCSSSSRWGS